MYKVTLKYNMFEEQIIMQYLYINNVKICKTSYFETIIKVPNTEFLSKLLATINRQLTIGVTVKKVKRCLW